jgi:hypothetical protein
MDQNPDSQEEPALAADSNTNAQVLDGTDMSVSDSTRMLNAAAAISETLTSSGHDLVKELRFFQRRLVQLVARHKAILQSGDPDFTHTLATVLLTRARELDSVIALSVTSELSLLEFAPQVRSFLELTCVYVGSTIDVNNEPGAKHLLTAMGKDHSRFMKAMFALSAEQPQLFSAVASDLGIPPGLMSDEAQRHNDRAGLRNGNEVTWSHYYKRINHNVPVFLSPASGTYWEILNKLVHPTSLSLLDIMAGQLLEMADQNADTAEIVDLAKTLRRVFPTVVENMLHNVLLDCNILVLMKAFVDVGDVGASNRMLRIRRLLSKTYTILPSFDQNLFVKM